MIENYITTLAFLIILKSILTFALFVKSRTDPFRKGFTQRLLGRYDFKFRLILKLSILWLIVFFYSHILHYVKLFSLYMQSIFL